MTIGSGAETGCKANQRGLVSIVLHFGRHSCFWPEML